MQKLDEFEKITDKAIEDKKISHAYLIEIRTKEDQKKVIDFAKKLLNISLTEEEDKRKNNYLVDNNTNPDMKIIFTAENWIKKEEIINIQTEFSNKSLKNGNRVYIIEEAEKMNKSSANTLLKFLEEPNDNIIGILTTKNKHLVMPTIISRCIYFNIASNKDTEISKDKEYIENLLGFTTNLETKNEKAVAYFHLYDQTILTNRVELKEFLTNILLLYNDILYVMINIEPTIYADYKDRLLEFAQNNTRESITKKVNALEYCIDKLNYNVNTKLLLDKLNILMK